MRRSQDLRYAKDFESNLVRSKWKYYKEFDDPTNGDEWWAVGWMKMAEPYVMHVYDSGVDEWQLSWKEMQENVLIKNNNLYFKKTPKIGAREYGALEYFKPRLDLFLAAPIVDCGVYFGSGDCSIRVEKEGSLQTLFKVHHNTGYSNEIYEAIIGEGTVTSYVRACPGGNSEKNYTVIPLPCNYVIKVADEYNKPHWHGKIYLAQKGVWTKDIGYIWKSDHVEIFKPEKGLY